MSNSNKQVRKDIINKLMRMNPADRARFFTELDAERERHERKEKSPWPRVVKMYAHQSEEVAWNNGEEIGLDMERIGQWCPLYEVEFHVEVQKNGDTKILACDGFMVDYDHPYDGSVFKIRGGD